MAACPGISNPSPLTAYNEIKTQAFQKKGDDKIIMENNPNMMMENCVPYETVIKNVKLAHAYVPIQKMCATFSPMNALKKGTAFPPLTGMYEWGKGQMEDMDV